MCMCALVCEFNFKEEKVKEGCNLFTILIL